MPKDGKQSFSSPAPAQQGNSFLGSAALKRPVTEMLPLVPGAVGSRRAVLVVQCNDSPALQCFALLIMRARL